MVIIIVETIMLILIWELLLYLKTLSTRWAQNASIPLAEMYSDKDLEYYFNT